MNTAEIIWLSGIVPAYFIVKEIYKLNKWEWTKGSRPWALHWSLYSWFLLFILLVTIVQNWFEEHGDEPAKW